MRKINIVANLQQNRKFVEGLRNLAEVCDIPIAKKESCCNTALYPFSQEGQEGWVQVENASISLLPLDLSMSPFNLR